MLCLLFVQVTLTLVVIILMNLGLVTPSELLKYAMPYTDPDVAVAATTAESVDHQSPPIVHIVADVANALQALNFAVNFFLYCVLNPHFRLTVTRMFGCRAQRTGCRTAANIDIEARSGGTFRCQTASTAAAVVSGLQGATSRRDRRLAGERRLSMSTKASCCTELGLLIADTSTSQLNAVQPVDLNDSHV